MPRIVTHPGAELDVAESVAFYAEEQPGVELRFTSELRRTYDRIVRGPDLFPIEFGKVRRCRMGRFPFRIFYVNRGEIVFVLAVAHAKRQPNYWKSRMS